MSAGNLSSDHVETGFAVVFVVVIVAVVAVFVVDENELRPQAVFDIFVMVDTSFLRVHVRVSLNTNLDEVGDKCISLDDITLSTYFVFLVSLHRTSQLVKLYVVVVS